MDYWQFLGWAIVCSTGGLAFLTIVANDVHRVRVTLEHFKRREQRKFQQRLDYAQCQPPSGDVIEEMELVSPG